MPPLLILLVLFFFFLAQGLFRECANASPSVGYLQFRVFAIESTSIFVVVDLSHLTYAFQAFPAKI